MKIIKVPTRVFEIGERAYAPEGWVTVVHDELEGILEDQQRNRQTNDEIAKLSVYRKGVVVKLEEETSNNDVGDEITVDRDMLIPENEFNK